MSSSSPFVFVLTGIVMSAAAQIFLKIGSSFRVLKFEWLLYLFLSLCCYAIAFLGYYLALRYYEISKISPVMMASIVAIVAIYGFLSGERFNLPKLFGIALAIVSIIMISRS